MLIPDYDNYNTIIWTDEVIKKPTEEELKAIDDALEYEMELRVVQDARAAVYPSSGEQFDKIWHAIDGDEALKTIFADFYDTIKAVKDENPLPTIESDP